MNWKLVAGSVLAVGSCALVVAAGLVAYFYFQGEKQERSQLEQLSVSVKEADEEDPIDYGKIEFEKIVAMVNQQNWQRVEDLAALVVSEFPQSTRVPDAKRILTQMRLDRILSRDDYPGKQLYTVRSGDSLGAIASRFDSSYLYVVRMSGLMNAPVIQPNDQLVVCPLNFELRVDLERSALEVYERELVADEAAVAEGEMLGETEQELDEQELLDEQRARDVERFVAMFAIQQLKLPLVMPRTGDLRVRGLAAVLEDGSRVATTHDDFLQGRKEISLGSGLVIREGGLDEEPELTGIYLRPQDMEDLMLLLRTGEPVQWVD